MIRRTLTAAALAGAVLAASPAWAGPPYVTDDPAPTERGHWEVYSFVGGSHTPGETAGEGGLDLNYGGAENLQLTLVVPAAYSHTDRTWVGMGVVEAAAKFQLLHQEGPAGFDLAIFPRLFLPTAPSRFASPHANLLLPVWVGRDFGPWAVFGGGGYQINPGAGNRDFWTGGLAVTRSLSDRLSVGAEVFHHSRDAIDAKALTGVNLGVTYKLSDHWSLLASGGPGVQNARDEGQYDFYISLKADY